MVAHTRTEVGAVLSVSSFRAFPLVVAACLVVVLASVAVPLPPVKVQRATTVVLVTDDRAA